MECVLTWTAHIYVLVVMDTQWSRINVKVKRHFRCTFCNYNGTRLSGSIMGEHSFGVLAGSIYNLKTVFAQVQLSPLYSTHTDGEGEGYTCTD